MNDVERLYTEEGLAVLVSPGYGIGWSTENGTDLAIDKRVVQAFMDGVSGEEIERLCKEWGYGDIYAGSGWSNCKIVYIPVGTLFQIREYDGAEWIETYNDSTWMQA